MIKGRCGWKRRNTVVSCREGGKAWKAPRTLECSASTVFRILTALQEGSKTLKGSIWQKAVLNAWCWYAVWSVSWFNAGFWLTSSGEFLLPCWSMFVTVLWLRLGEEFIFKVYYNTSVAILLYKTYLGTKKNHCNHSKSTSFVLLLQRCLLSVTQNFNNIIFVLNVGVYNSPCLISAFCTRVTQKTQNYLLEGGALCSTGFPLWMSVLGTHLYQCTRWRCCERLCSASVNFLWRLFWCLCSCPHCAECSAVFEQKWHDPHVLSSLFIQSHPKQLLFCFLGWKNSQRETFCWCGRGEIENGRSNKRHQNWYVQKLFWAVGKLSQ